VVAVSFGPNATLGPSITVDIERPRDKTAMNHHPRFKAIRNEVTSYLLDSSKQRRPRRKEPMLPVALPSPVEANA